MSDYDEEELINYSRLSLNNKKGRKGSRQQQQAPRRSEKSAQADSTSVEIARQALFECIEYKAPVSRKSSSKGTLQACAPFWTSISVSKGAHLHTMGFSHQGVTKLYPEEAAFLISRNALVVENKQGEELGFQDFCEILCDPDTDGWISFDKYQVYAYLKRLGYIVLRSKPRSTLPPSPAPIEENSSSNISLWKLFFDKISYWIYKNQTIPLVWNYKYADYRSIYSTLQIIPSSPWYKPFYNSLCRTFDWDVYKPRPNWKKKDPGVPDFQIVVNNINDPMPCLHEQNQLFYQLMGQLNTNYQPSRNTELKEFGPTFIMGLVGDAEGISFLRMVGDGLADIVEMSNSHNNNEN